MDIVVENVSKSYGAHLAVDNISFRVLPGEVLGFLGPNGAGKTTTMKVITCFMTPDAGDIRVGGLSVRTGAEEVKKHVGYLPETNPLYPDMPVIDYLRFTAELHGIPRRQVRGRIAEMISICGLRGEKHKKIGELSKGYQQRVGLAQALIHDPRVLVLDEPTSGLDPNQIAEIRGLIKRIGKEKTVILSSHILAEVEATCDRILIINRGKIVADGTADTLRKASGGTEVHQVQIEGGQLNDILQAMQKLETVARVDISNPGTHLLDVYSHPGRSSARHIFDACVKNGWFLTRLVPQETKLEDVFRELTLN